MTTQQLANRLAELCRQGKIDEVQTTLFTDNAQSIESTDAFGPKVTTGLAAIKAKGAAFQALKRLLLYYIKKLEHSETSSGQAFCMALSIAQKFLIISSANSLHLTSPAS